MSTTKTITITVAISEAEQGKLDQWIAFLNEAKALHKTDWTEEQALECLLRAAIEGIEQ